jgi:hypothetical protein
MARRLATESEDRERATDGWPPVRITSAGRSLTQPVSLFRSLLLNPATAGRAPGLRSCLGRSDLPLGFFHGRTVLVSLRGGSLPRHVLRRPLLLRPFLTHGLPDDVQLLLSHGVQLGPATVQPFGKFPQLDFEGGRGVQA